MSALTTISSDRFQEMLDSEIYRNQVIVALQAPTFDIEDIANETEVVVPSSFTYIPNVQNPGKILREKIKGGNSSLENLMDDLETGRKSLFIDLNEKLSGVMISLLYQTLSKHYPNITLIYTGYRRSKTHHVKRSIDHLPLESKYVLISAETVIERSGHSKETITEIQSIATKVNGSTINVTLFPIHFTLKFILQGNVWSLSSAVNEDGVRYTIPKYVSALETYSYRCGTNLTFISHEHQHVIKITNSQILVSFKQEHPKFDLKKIVYCNGFVTPGILSGLFVVTLFLGILLCGLMSIMSIKTMDRYDNSHTKGFIVVEEY